MVILFINTFSIHQVKSDKVKGKHCIEVKHWCLKVILKSLLTMFLLAQKVCLSLMFLVASIRHLFIFEFQLWEKVCYASSEYGCSYHC